MRTLVEKDDNKGDGSDCDSSDDFSRLHLKAPELEDKEVKRIYAELLGFPLTSQLDHKLV